jgi:hypothetical protein
MGKNWELVWRPVCFMGAPPGRVSPGDSLVFDLLVAAFKTISTYPQLDSRMIAGTYRLVLPMGYSTRPDAITELLPVKQRTSPTFVLKASKAK